MKTFNAIEFKYFYMQINEFLRGVTTIQAVF